MLITIYGTKTISALVNKTDASKSFKKREGYKPASLDTTLIINIDDSKINLKWKKLLSEKIRISFPKMYKIVKINLKTDTCEYSINVATNNSEGVANLIGNYILDKRKPLQIDNKNIETKFLNQYKKQNNENN